MGSKQSSLAKKSSSDNTEETKKPEVKLGGERGLNEIQNKEIIESVEVVSEIDSEYESSDDESEVEEGM